MIDCRLKVAVNVSCGLLLLLPPCLLLPPWLLLLPVLAVLLLLLVGRAGTVALVPGPGVMALSVDCRGKLGRTCVGMGRMKGDGL